MITAEEAEGINLRVCSILSLALFCSYNYVLAFSRQKVYFDNHSPLWWWMWWTVHKYGSVGRNLGGEGCGERVGLGEWVRGEGEGLEGGWYIAQIYQIVIWGWPGLKPSLKSSLEKVSTQTMYVGTDSSSFQDLLKGPYKSFSRLVYLFVKFTIGK